MNTQQEQTIFQSPQNPPQPQQGNIPQQPPPPENTENAYIPIPQTEVPITPQQMPAQQEQQAKQPPSNPPESPPPSEPPRLLPIIKIGIGILAVIIVIVLLFFLALRFIHVGPIGGKVTLQYWGLWEDPNVMQSLIADFEKTNPDIVIEYTKQDPKQYTERLFTRAQQGTGPDMFRFHPSWMPMIQSLLAPLSSDVITGSEFTKVYYPVIQQDLVKNGAIYGLPLEIDTLALFTNTQLLQSAGLNPPSDWPGFINTAKTLTVKEVQTGKIRRAGAALGTYDNITHAPDILSMLFFQNGVDFNNLSGSAQNESDALTFYTSFAKGDSDTTVWDNTLDPSISAFAKGNLAMYFGYSYDIFTIKALNPNLQFTVNSVPQLPKRNMTVASYWVEGVSGKSRHQKEAMVFMKFLASKDTQQKLYSEQAKTRLFGEPYARTDLADTVKGNALLYPFLAQAKNAKSSIFAGETFDTGIDAQLNGYLGNAVRGVLGGTSPQSAIDGLDQGITQVFGQYAAKQK